jgi:hypothetical protein
MRDRQRLGAVALAVGVILMVVGGAGALSDANRGGTAIGPSPSPGTTQAPSPTPPSTAVPSPSPTPSPDIEALARTFFVELVRANRERDVDDMMAWLHPATIERYGEDACRRFLASRNDPTFSVVIESVVAEPFFYTTDNQATEIPDAWTVRAQVTNAGETASRELHVAPVDGAVRWFTDCGNPLGASPAP